MRGATVKLCLKCRSNDRKHVQDSWYGRFKRVFTIGREKLTCTVCGSVEKADPDYIRTLKNKG